MWSYYGGLAGFKAPLVVLVVWLMLMLGTLSSKNGLLPSFLAIEARVLVIRCIDENLSLHLPQGSRKDLSKHFTQLLQERPARVVRGAAEAGFLLKSAIYLIIGIHWPCKKKLHSPRHVHAILSLTPAPSSARPRGGSSQCRYSAALRQMLNLGLSNQHGIQSSLLLDYAT
ncbi:hypothetical protein HDV62DRAFT_113501 [Trichoderma sp. SZMC 28011]